MPFKMLEENVLCKKSQHAAATLVSLGTLTDLDLFDVFGIVMRCTNPLQNFRQVFKEPCCQPAILPKAGYKFDAPLNVG
jgi:hypothetical protein